MSLNCIHHSNIKFGKELICTIHKIINLIQLLNLSNFKQIINLFKIKK